MTLRSGQITWVSALKAPVHSRLPLKCWPSSAAAISASAPRRRLIAQIKRADVFPRRSNRSDTLPLPLKASGAEWGAQVCRSREAPPRDDDRSGLFLLRWVDLPAVLKVTQNLHSSDSPDQAMRSEQGLMTMTAGGICRGIQQLKEGETVDLTNQVFAPQPLDKTNKSRIMRGW